MPQDHKLSLELLVTCKQILFLHVLLQHATPLVGDVYQQHCLDHGAPPLTSHGDKGRELEWEKCMNSWVGTKQTISGSQTG